MKKKLILVAAPPACGKNYVSELICGACESIAYFDKDDLADLLRRSFTLCGEEINMDGAFYLQHLREYEYKTLLRLAFSGLQYTRLALVNAPFLKEVRDIKYMLDLKKTAALHGAELVLVWVTASSTACYERMKARGSDRDGGKLAAWDAYVSRTDYSAPKALEECGAVDHLFVFDNENEETADASLQQFLKIIGE